MSLSNRIAVSVVLSALAVLASCGGNGNAKSSPPPSGSFSNSNLTGTYVFSTTGSDINGVFMAIAGSFTASGTGNITGGAIDVNDPELGTLIGQPITGGHYNVGVDGRPSNNIGLLTLQTSAGNFTFDYVLTSSTHGLLTLYDSANGTGSGTLDAQSNVAPADIATKSYALNLSGIGSFNSGTFQQTPLATVGAVTLDSNGNVSSGLQDFNNNGLAICGANACTVSAGFIDLSTVPGTASFSSNAGTFNFDVYPVDSTHLKLIETDSGVIMTGDAFTAANAIPTGNNVFTVSGFDSVVQFPFVAAGLLDTDGNGNLVSDSVEDINDAFAYSEVGSVTGSAISGTYTAVSGGRSVLTLNGFANGTSGTTCNGCVFAAYPSSGGTQLLEIDNSGVTAGVAYPQTPGATFSSGDGYGMNLFGINNVEEDDIAEFTNTSGSLGGVIDFNDLGTLSFAKSFSSTYTADSSVSGRGTVAPGKNAFNLVTYAIDSSTSVFVEIDNNQIGLGAFVKQNSGAQSNAAQRHLAVLGLKVKAGAKTALRKQK